MQQSNSYTKIFTEMPKKYLDQSSHLMLCANHLAFVVLQTTAPTSSAQPRFVTAWQSMPKTNTSSPSPLLLIYSLLWLKELLLKCRVWPQADPHTRQFICKHRCIQPTQQADHSFWQSVQLCAGKRGPLLSVVCFLMAFCYCTACALKNPFAISSRMVQKRPINLA